MMQSFLIKLGMLTATMAAVFWIGWTAPTAPDQRAKGAPTTNQVHTAASGADAVVGQMAAPLVSPSKPMPSEKIRPAGKRLDVNRATAEDFESLPGIGPVLAKRIVEYRRTNGNFRTVEQLKQVKGIGAKKFERVRSLLNAAPAERPMEKTKGTA